MKLDKHTQVVTIVITHPKNPLDAVMVARGFAHLILAKIVSAGDVPRGTTVQVATADGIETATRT